MNAVLNPRALPFIHPDDMPDLYALIGTGTCMEPVVVDRALMAFDKTKAPRPGDIVSLIFTRQYAAKVGVPGMVKRLALGLPPSGVRQAGLAWAIIAEQINPPRQYSFRSTDVLAVHKCVGFAENAGEGLARFRVDQEPPRSA